MKLRRVTLLAVCAVIFQATLLAHGQSQQRVSRINRTEDGQESTRPSRGNLRFSVLATDINSEKIRLESKVTDATSARSKKGNYRTVSRFDTENDKILGTPVISDKTYKGVNKLLSVDIETEPQSVPRPTRQSRSRSLEDGARGKRGRIITDDEIEPIGREVVLDEENVTPSNGLRRRPFSRARQGNDKMTTKLGSVSSQNDRIESRKSVVRTSLFANRRMDDAANARSQNVVGSRRAPTRNKNNADVKVKQSSELGKKIDEPTNRGSVRGSSNFKRPNRPKKGDEFEVNEDDNYPEEFIKKIKKSSADNVILSAQLKEDFVVVTSTDKVLKSKGSTQTPESKYVSSIEETSPIPQPRTSTRPLLSARRKAINSRVLNNAVTPTSSTLSSSTSRSRGELTSEQQLRSKPSFRSRTSTLPTAPAEESIAQGNYSKENTQIDEDNYLLSQKSNVIDSIPNILSTEKSISRRPTYKARPSYVPKSRVKSTSERSKQIVVPIKPGLRTRPSLPRFNPDTPRPLQPLISTRLRGFAAVVTQEYVGDVSPTGSPTTRRFQTPRSRRPSKPNPITLNDKSYDEEERNISPRPNPRESGAATERVKFKPREMSTPFKYASELRRNHQKTSTESEKPEIKTLSQLGAGAPRHRFSSRYRSQQIKSSRSSTPVYVATLPQIVTSPATFTTDYSQNTDLSTETLDIEESTILDTTDVGPLLDEDSSVELDSTTMINNEEVAPARLQNGPAVVISSAETVTPSTIATTVATGATKSLLTVAGTTAFKTEMTVTVPSTSTNTTDASFSTSASTEPSSSSATGKYNTNTSSSTNEATETTETTETTATTKKPITEAPITTTATTNSTTGPITTQQKTDLKNTTTTKSTTSDVTNPKVTTSKPTTSKPTAQKPKPITKTSPKPTTQNPQPTQKTSVKATTQKPTTQTPKTTQKTTPVTTTSKPTSKMPTSTSFSEQETIAKTPSLLGIAFSTPKQTLPTKQNVSPSDAFINAINTTLIAIRITPTIEGRFAVRVAVAPRGTMSSTTASPSITTAQSNYTTQSSVEEIKQNSLDSPVLFSIDRMDNFDDTSHPHLSPPNKEIQDFKVLSLTLEEYLNSSKKNEIENPKSTTPLAESTSTPSTPYPFVIYGIFPNNTVFRKYPNTGKTEIVDEREIARKDPYFPASETTRTASTTTQKTIDDGNQVLNRLDSNNSSTIDSAIVTTRIGLDGTYLEEISMVTPGMSTEVKHEKPLSPMDSPENITAPMAHHKQTNETSSTPTTELSQPFSTENTNSDIDTVNRINTIIAKPEVSNAVYTGKDSKYNNFWSSSTSTTEKLKFRFLTVNLSPGTSVETPPQTQTPLETSTKSTTVFRWKPVTDSINDSDSSEVTTLSNTEQSMTLANIYKLNETETSKSEDLPATTASTFTNMDATTRTSTTSIKLEGTTRLVTTTTITMKPTTATTTKKPTTTTTTKKPTTTTTKKPTTTTTTKKPITTKKSTTSTTKKPVTTTTPTTTTSTTTTSTTTTSTSTTTTSTAATTAAAAASTTTTSSTERPTTTTKKSVSTTKKPATTTKKPTSTTKKPATTGATTKKLTATTSSTNKMPPSTTRSTVKTTDVAKAIIINPEQAVPSIGSSPENKPPDERYIDDILLLNTLLQGGAGPSVSLRTGRTQNAQLVLANQIIELALMRAATSTSKPKISTTTENYRDFLKALVSSSQASFQETALGPTQKELENFVLNYKDDDVEDILLTPDNLPKTAIKKPEKSTTTANLGLTNDDDILAALLDEQLAATKAPKKPKPAKKPTTPAPSGLSYLLQAFSGARNNQQAVPISGYSKAQTSKDERPASSQGEGGIPPSTDPGLLNAAINVTRAVSQFMGYVIQGAAESFQNYVRSRTGGFLTNYFNLGVANPS